MSCVPFAVRFVQVLAILPCHSAPKNWGMGMGSCHQPQTSELVIRVFSTMTAEKFVF